MIEAILIDNASRFALVGIDMRFEEMLNSLKFLDLLLAVWHGKVTIFT